MNYTQRMHQGCAPQHVMTNGGGSGGSSQAYYANMDKLYGVQSQAAQYMLDQSMPYLPGAVSNSAGMTQEAMSGALGNRLRSQAATDADASAGESMNAMNDNLASYGVNPNSGAFAGMNRKLAVSNAANKTSAMNQAGLAAEDQKWNRNAGMFGQLTGMGNGAMQGLGQSADGYGAAGNSMASNDAQNAAGMGAFGASVGRNFADGGEVRLAAGGDPWSAYKNQNPISTSSGLRRSGSGAGALAQGLAMGVGSKVVGDAAKSAYKGSGLESAVKGFTDKVGYEAKGLYHGLGAPSAGEFTVPTATEFGSAFPTVGPEMAAEALDPMAVGQAASMYEVAAPVATATSEAAPVLAAAAEALPYVFFARDGGEARKDFRPGGKVAGPGTETSDSIPARLSDGEFVLNAEAVRLVGKKKLEQWNKQGLDIRNKKGTGLKLAKGGSVKKGC